MGNFQNFACWYLTGRLVKIWFIDVWPLLILSVSWFTVVLLLTLLCVRKWCCKCGVVCRFIISMAVIHSSLRTENHKQSLALNIISYDILWIILPILMTTRGEQSFDFHLMKLYDKCILFYFILSNNTAVDDLEFIQWFFLLCVSDNWRFSVSVKMAIVSEYEKPRSPSFDMFAYNKKCVKIEVLMNFPVFLFSTIFQILCKKKSRSSKRQVHVPRLYNHSSTLSDYRKRISVLHFTGCWKTHHY